jgi:hypothetical protein
LRDKVWLFSCLDLSLYWSSLGEFWVVLESDYWQMP